MQDECAEAVCKTVSYWTVRSTPYNYIFNTHFSVPYLQTKATDRGRKKCAPLSLWSLWWRQQEKWYLGKRTPTHLAAGWDWCLSFRLRKQTAQYWSGQPGIVQTHPFFPRVCLCVCFLALSSWNFWLLNVGQHTVLFTPTPHYLVTCSRSARSRRWLEERTHRRVVSKEWGMGTRPVTRAWADHHTRYTFLQQFGKHCCTNRCWFGVFSLLLNGIYSTNHHIPSSQVDFATNDWSWWGLVQSKWQTVNSWCDSRFAVLEVGFDLGAES